MTGRWKLLVLWSVLCFLIVMPGLAAAEDMDADSLYKRGRFELSDGNYEAALKFLNQAISQEPTNLNFQFARGQALVKMRLFDEAEAQFLAILKADPIWQKGVHTELASLYALKQDWRQSAESYSKAIGVWPKRANLYLARGSVYTELKDYGSAEADFSKAVQLDSKTAPRAMFHRALISFRQDDYKGARDRLDQAMALKPDAGLAKQINLLGIAVDKAEKKYKSWEITATFLLQYDDNVSLEPLDGWGAAAPGVGTSGKDDMSYGLAAKGSYFFIHKRAQEIGLSYTFRNQIYTNLSENDLFSHTLGGFFSHNTDPWYFRIEADAGFYWANQEEKMTLYSVRPAVTRVFGPLDRTMFMSVLEYKRMLDDTEDVRRYILGALHYHTFKIRDPRGITARAGLQWEYESSIEDDATASRLYELKTGATFPLPLKLNLDVGLDYAWIYFDFDPVIDPDVEREDTRVILSAKLGRSFGKDNQYRAEVLWSHTYNDSNLTEAEQRDIYEFKRNVFSVILTGTF